MLVAQSMNHFYGRELREEKVLGRKISLPGQKPQPSSLLLPRAGVVEGEAGEVSTGGSSRSQVLLGRPDLPVQAGPVSTPRQRGRAERRALIRLGGISVQV